MVHNILLLFINFAHLTELTDNWLKQMDEGNLTGVTLLDFSKDFDLVNHDI